MVDTDRTVDDHSVCGNTQLADCVASTSSISGSERQVSDLVANTLGAYTSVCRRTRSDAHMHAYTGLPLIYIQTPAHTRTKRDTHTHTDTQTEGSTYTQLLKPGDGFSLFVDRIDSTLEQVSAIERSGIQASGSVRWLLHLRDAWTT